MAATPTLTEIAKRIDAHLKRFEADPELNPTDARYQTRPFYMAGASRAGNRVSVLYVAYRSSSTLTRSKAEAYLAWLDAGNVGSHFAMEAN